jgi:hypothetical protein
MAARHSRSHDDGLTLVERMAIYSTCISLFIYSVSEKKDQNSHTLVVTSVYIMSVRRDGRIKHYLSISLKVLGPYNATDTL